MICGLVINRIVYASVGAHDGSLPVSRESRRKMVYGGYKLCVCCNEALVVATVQVKGVAMPYPTYQTQLQ